LTARHGGRRWTVIKAIVDFVLNHPLEDHQKGIKYAPTTDLTNEISTELQRHGVSCQRYIGKDRQEEKDKEEERWRSSRGRWIAGTPAFSTGVNEKWVRFVLTAYGSYSPEDYLQETGRAGRDGSPATAVTFACRTFSAKFFDPNAPLEKSQRLHSILSGKKGCIRKALHKYNDGLPTIRCQEGGVAHCWVCDE
jgi:superfamily II DNA helicase RecQ